MGLNISKGNMYDFVTHTWNTVKGKCPHGCSYCYMKKWKNQKEVRFDRSELKTDLGSGNFIFVGSSCDLFAEGISERWIMETLWWTRKFDNSYLFQTKNPKRASYFIEWPEKVTFCTTIETNRWYEDHMNYSPSPLQRATGMAEISKYYPTYCTIEPIMDFDLTPLINTIKLFQPTQVNIGADSGGHGLPEPTEEKIGELIDRLSGFTRVVQKKNLKRLWKN